MKKMQIGLAVVLGAWLSGSPGVLPGQATNTAKSAEQSANDNSTNARNANCGRACSGMYSFLKDGEFVQVTVEDQGRVTGFISRFGDGESDKGAFLDQFFKTGKLDGNKLSFTTEVVHGVSFAFNGTVERGEGKIHGDEAYYVLKGTLTESSSDVNKNVTSHARDIVCKMFPQEAAPAPVVRK